MPETDLIWMSLVVFLPSVFALGLLAFPRGWDSAMCWWSLAGTALTLGVSIGMFINFKADTIDLYGVNADSTNRHKASLEYRATQADVAPEGAVSRAKDWVARYPW